MKYDFDEEDRKRERLSRAEPMCETSEPMEPPVEGNELERMKADIAWRIHDAFDYRSEREIASLLKISSRTVERFLSGRDFPSTELLLQIHRVTGASLHWILTGQGFRFPNVSRHSEHFADEWAELGLA